MRDLHPLTRYVHKYLRSWVFSGDMRTPKKVSLWRGKQKESPGLWNGCTLIHYHLSYPGQIINQMYKKSQWDKAGGRHGFLDKAHIPHIPVLRGRICCVSECEGFVPVLMIFIFRAQRRKQWIKSSISTFEMSLIQECINLVNWYWRLFYWVY